MAEVSESTSRRDRLVPWVLAGGALAFLALSVLTFTASRGWGYDFSAYYTAAMRLARGESMYVSWTITDPFSPGPFGLYLYAPPLAALVLPFTLLSQGAAIALWFALRVGLLFVGCAVMPVRASVRLLAFAVAAVSFPVLIDLNLGNVSVVVMVLLAATWRWLDRPAGSIALALAMSVRPTLGLLLIWWLLRRMWRPVLWTVLAGLLLIVMTIPVVGITSYQTFVHVLQNISEVTGVANNLDLGSTVLRLGAGPLLATIVLYGGYILGIGAMLVSLRFDRETSYMVTIGATMLLAPLLWDHYLATLVLPAALLAQRGRTWGLALPLLAWLPPPFLPFLAVAGTVLPFAVARSRGPRQVSPAPTQDPMVPVPAPTGALETVHAAVATDGQAAAGSISASNTTASPG